MELYLGDLNISASERLIIHQRCVFAMKHIYNISLFVLLVLSVQSIPAAFAYLNAISVS